MARGNEMTNEYLTAKQARDFSFTKNIDDFPEECKKELIDQIERSAMAGEHSIIFVGEAYLVEELAPYLKKGYRQFIESLGYRVKLNVNTVEINRKTVSTQCLEISW